MACPARGDDVNPQFACRSCPFASEMETHDAVDDLGQPYQIVDAVECRFSGGPADLPTRWLEFPSLLAGVVPDAPPRIEAGVACPLLSSPDRTAPMCIELDGVRWVPTGNCRTCQFYRGTKGTQLAFSPGADAGVIVVCTGPAEASS